jgi:threonine dehydrogenase-like Zn-dependent dehydrogenase
MKALVYLGPNHLVHRDEPDPLPGAGEALVAVEAVGICGSDMHAYHGHDERRPPPLILGHEAAGTVLTGLLAGKRVTINPLVIDPDCSMAQAGRPHLSPTRQILSMPPRQGAFAGLVVAPERNLVVLPDGLAMAEAALAEPLAVSLHAARRGLAMVAPNGGPDASALRCLVQGGGAIGVGAVLALRLDGVTRITLAEPNQRRRERLSDLGAEVAAPEALEGSSRFDLVIDAVGAAATRREASRLAAPGATIVHVGLLPGADGLDIRRLTLQEITLTGSYCYTHAEFVDVVSALASQRFGRLDWFDVRPLSGGADAFADIDGGRCDAPKIILRP